jgi:arsenate reductase
MAEQAVFNVLFLCTGNSARSILAESLLNQLGRERFRAFSAGSHPGGRVNPLALELLVKNHFPTGELRSKSWDEFAQPAAPHLDFVITVCDNAAGETCPVWPGQPMTAHWGIPDPAAAAGSDEHKRHAFVEAMNQLQRRISMFVSLPFHTLDSMKLQQAVRAIGKTT